MKIYWNGKTKNIIGPSIRVLRKQAKLTQKELAEKLQLQGYDFSDLTILRIEQGSRFVPDYEVLALARFFQVSPNTLLDGSVISEKKAAHDRCCFFIAIRRISLFFHRYFRHLIRICGSILQPDRILRMYR